MRWSESSTASTLWLEGKPGSGKSTLTNHIVHKLESTESGVTNARPTGSQTRNPIWTFDNPRDKSTIIARFYYSCRGGNRETSHELMLRSFVHQIWKSNSRLYPLLRDRFRELQKSSNVSRDKTSIWSYEDLKMALRSLHEIDFGLKIVIVVDGLDESDDDRRADILRFLPGLAVPGSRCVVKLLISSRPESDINGRLMHSCSHHIRLQDVNKEDIRLAVDTWIRRMESERNCRRDTFRNIKNYIIEESLGVFLWVTLVLRDMEQCLVKGGYSIADLNERVRGLPKELGGEHGFYRQMVLSLMTKCDEDREQEERGRRIFHWVTFAKRAISVPELQDVLATPQSQETDLRSYNFADNRPLELFHGILSACGGLVEVSILLYQPTFILTKFVSRCEARTEA
jgi:hypothetical protein